jgi:hypothetical protein
MSTSGLFQASRPDGRSDWRVVFDRVADVEYWAEVTHDELLAELETEDRGRLYRAVGRANRELWKTREKSLAVVRGKGYRVLHPSEHERLAEGYKQQARKRMGNSVAVMQATNLSELSSQEREWAVRVTAGLMTLARVMDEHAAKLARHDELLSELREKVERIEGEGS